MLRACALVLLGCVLVASPALVSPAVACIWLLPCDTTGSGAVGRGLQPEDAVVVFARSCGSVCNKPPPHAAPCAFSPAAQNLPLHTHRTSVQMAHGRRQGVDDLLCDPLLSSCASCRSLPRRREDPSQQNIFALAPRPVRRRCAHANTVHAAREHGTRAVYASVR